MTSAFSWQNSVSLCPASFCTPTPNLPVTPGSSWLPTFAFQSPMMKRHLFGVLVLESLVGLHRAFQFQHLQLYWLGRRHGLLWYWMVCLGNKHRSFCHFWDCTQVLHFRLYVLVGGSVERMKWGAGKKGNRKKPMDKEKRLLGTSDYVRMVHDVAGGMGAWLTQTSVPRAPQELVNYIQFESSSVLGYSFMHSFT